MRDVREMSRQVTDWGSPLSQTDYGKLQAIAVEADLNLPQGDPRRRAVDQQIGVRTKQLDYEATRQKQGPELFHPSPMHPNILAQVETGMMAQQRRDEVFKPLPQFAGSDVDRQIEEGMRKFDRAAKRRRIEQPSGSSSSTGETTARHDIPSGRLQASSSRAVEQPTQASDNWTYSGAKGRDA